MNVKVRELSTQELETLLKAIERELARRQEQDAEVARRRNAQLREAREILYAAGIGRLKGWERPGDRRLYVAAPDGRGRRWGGSRKYPVEFYYLLDGTAREEPGWHCTQPVGAQHLPDVAKAVEEALAILGETLESACRYGFRL